MIMLNEIKEYEQYSFPIITSDKNYVFSMSRLKRRSLINNSFSGIDRAMLMVARYWMFSYERETALTALKLWCGTKSVPEGSLAETLRNWFPDYIRYSLMQARLDDFMTKKESSNPSCPDELCNLVERLKPKLELKNLQACVSDIESFVMDSGSKQIFNIYNQNIKPVTKCVEKLRAFSGKPQDFDKKMFNSNEQNVDKNDMKAITYEGVLAKAFYAGPLKRFYLCCDDCSLLDSNAYTKQQMDMILKTISAFLLNKNRNNPNQKWAFISKTDIVNWLVDFNRADKYMPEELGYVNGTKTTIFQTQKVSRNCVKLKVHDEWIKHFSIVEESFFNEEDWENGVFFRDDGSQSYLVKNKIYQ